MAALLAASLLVGCGGDDLPGAADPTADTSAATSAVTSPAPRPSSPASLTPATRRPAPSPTLSLDDWDIGAQVLPRRPDGFGEVRRTPAELRVRRLATPDRLPPPPDDRFRSSVRTVTPALARRTSLAWEPGCPVALGDLRLLTLSFWGFDDRPHTGRLVVDRSVADDVVSVFRRLHEARFPIEQMELVTLADLDAPPTGDGNNTAAYACRAARGSTTWSSHAYGLAVDVNPFMNPYTRSGPSTGSGGSSDLVLPELASAYLDRSWRRPGMVLAGGVVARAFADVGWTWGATFSSVDDPMHFSADGR